jgi:hypothetical protein
MSEQQNDLHLNLPPSSGIMEPDHAPAAAAAPELPLNQPPPLPNANTAATILGHSPNPSSSPPPLEDSGMGFFEYQCIWILLLLTIFVVMAIVFGALKWKN